MYNGQREAGGSALRPDWMVRDEYVEVTMHAEQLKPDRWLFSQELAGVSSDRLEQVGTARMSSAPNVGSRLHHMRRVRWVGRGLPATCVSGWQAICRGSRHAAGNGVVDDLVRRRHSQEGQAMADPG